MAEYLIDINKLPENVRIELNQLELELSEGDITQKGFEKKKALLLSPYLNSQKLLFNDQTTNQQDTPSTKEKQKHHRRVTKDDPRYHSEIRQEAVKAALALYNQKPSIIPSSKRTNQNVTSNLRQLMSDEDTSDDERDSLKRSSNTNSNSKPSPANSNNNSSSRLRNDSNQQQQQSQNVFEFISKLTNNSTNNNNNNNNNNQQQSSNPINNSSLSTNNTSGSNLLTSTSNGSTPPTTTTASTTTTNNNNNKNQNNAILTHHSILNNSTSMFTNSTASSSNERQQQPDITRNIYIPHQKADRIAISNRNYSIPMQLMQEANIVSNHHSNQHHNNNNNNDNDRQPSRVSAKIQQLLNTLKRPKRRPLNEYFEDYQEEVAIPPLDPTVPKPEGSVSVPACGEPLLVPQSFPQSIEAAIHKFANASSKATCITVLDHNGKANASLTYVKLLTRAQRVAYHLLNKSANKGEQCLKFGDRVALVFPNNDPIGFSVAFCGVLMAGLVALPIDVPLVKRDAGCQNLGFLLGHVGATTVLTSETCYKGLPKNPNTETVEFKGWPRLNWIVIENLSKTPKEWTPPNRLTPTSTAYIEYSTLKDGSVTGIAITREQMLCHCQTLNFACNYTEGETVVCVLDYKREFGLWHGIQSVIFNGMHVIYIPYSVMKINPSIWLSTVTKHKASIALVKSRDMHWGLMAQKDYKDINLSSLRMLLVADGANPWSLSSCDTFLDVFQSKGLRAESICPTSGSSETLTVSIRRPNRSGPQSSGRGVLSMSGLSYGVVRVDQENSLTSLTLQDVGQVLPGSLVGVLKLNGTSLCQTDEIGEICVSSKSTADRYFGLDGLTGNTFKVMPNGQDGRPIGNHEFVRSGLLGFLGPSGLVFVCGSKEGLIEVGGRRHNTDDVIATVLAVEPMKFIYRGRIAVFSIKVLKDERIIIVAEQRPDATEEETKTHGQHCFQWMSRVLQAVDSIHHVGVYCLALVPPNSLPKTPLGGIHIPETRTKFLEGTLHPTNVLMCPHTCVLNLPKPREHHPEREVGPGAVLAGSIVQGRRLAEAKGRDIYDDESDTAKKYQYLGDILRWRATTSPDHVLYTVINSKSQETQKLTCAQLHKKAERVGCLLLDKAQLSSGDHVALIFGPGTDLIVAFYGCLYVGLIPVPIRPPHSQNIQTTLPTVKMIVEMSRTKAILTISSTIKLLKSKEANAIFDSKQWPTLLDIEESTKKKLSAFHRPPSSDRLCYLDFSVSTTGMLAGIRVSHTCSTSICRAIKLSCELYPSREVVLCLDPYSGLGFVLWCLNSVYSGHHSILVPPYEVELNPCIWLATVSNYKVRDTFCSYSVMELCTKGLRSSVLELKQMSSQSSFSFDSNSGTLLRRYLKSRGINLSCVRTCAIVAEERPRIQLTSSFTKLFQSLGLPARSVSTTFGCRVNVAICLQGASDPDPTPVYVDQRALRNDRVSIVEKGSPHSICLLESGKLLPGVKVVIANPETKGQCADSHLGEIWVQSPHNSNGYFNVYGEELRNDHFDCHLATGDTISNYARTGFLGFVRRTDAIASNGEPHDAIYIVGSLDETLMIRGMRYHPIDIETTVLRCHKKICECACFTWTNLLVVVVELDGNENEALDLIPLVTNCVLEDHYLIVGVVVVVDPGVVPINSRGEKQRMHLRDGFLSDLLDPIYVAYNM